MNLIKLEDIYRARVRLSNIVDHTPLQNNWRMSETYGCHVNLKREDLQAVRSYKIRGAFNKMASLPSEELQRGIVCASAGNHAQGVAMACHELKVRGTIYMPAVTPQQKIGKVRLFGRDWVDVQLIGDTFDDAYKAACKHAEQKQQTFIHPFDDPKIIEGQATVGLEILEDSKAPIDYLLVPIGGGGLASGVGIIFQQLSPQTKIIGVEPAGAPAMQQSLAKGERIQLAEIDPFVDGAAVRAVGHHTFNICNQTLDRVITVAEGAVCTTILKLYNEEGIVVEPAGALTIAALDILQEELAGKQVVCVVSGSNNDITRTEEIKERALLYEGLKHYFLIRFPQRAGALREFLNLVLGPTD
ncbi:MAG: threonine ammonia-lyase, partial [Bacteroidota bacterium]